MDEFMQILSDEINYPIGATKIIHYPEEKRIEFIGTFGVVIRENYTEKTSYEIAYQYQIPVDVIVKRNKEYKLKIQYII